MISLPRIITESIQKVLNHPQDIVSLHEPSFSGNELKYIQECIESTFVSSVGKFVDRFEKELAEYTKAKHVVAVVNGTEALHIALLLAGVKSGDEVLVPSMSFVATANAVSYCGAVPHFVDSNEQTLGIDPNALCDWLKTITNQHSGVCVNRKTGKRIKALVPVHVYGNPCELEGLLKIASDFNLILIEDAAESIGSWYYGKHTGTFGLMGTLSFNGNKTITTGGGGAILTDNFDLARRAKHLSTTAKVAHKWEFIHNEIGFNYRMPNLNAALGCAQLEKLQQFIESKKRLNILYKKALKDVPNIKLFQESKGCNSNYWLQTLVFDESVMEQRDLALKYTNENGLMTRPVWKLLNTLPPYRNTPRAPLTVAESLERRLLNLPSSSGLV